MRLIDQSRRWIEQIGTVVGLSAFPLEDSSRR
jgi:hypothetical protein